MATSAAVVVSEDFKRDERGRKITPRARREEMVTAYRASGLTMAQFARKEGMKTSTLAKWSARLGKPGERIRFAEFKLGPLAATWNFEVTLPNGLAVRAANAPALVELLGLIRR